MKRYRKRVCSSGHLSLLAKMHLIGGKSRCNANAAARLSREISECYLDYRTSSSITHCRSDSNRGNGRSHRMHYEGVVLEEVEPDKWFKQTNIYEQPPSPQDVVIIEKPNNDMIPLHAGSNVYVSKSDLVRIFTPNPILYTSRLADLVFEGSLNDISLKQAKDRLGLLDQTRLTSLINHIVQVFVRRGTDMNEAMVRKYLGQKMNRIRHKILESQQIVFKRKIQEPSYLQYATTQRGRIMLIYAGYKYVKNRQSYKNIFWRCSRYVKYGCRATVVTSQATPEVTIRIAGSPHTHDPEVRSDNIHERSISTTTIATSTHTLTLPIADDDDSDGKDYIFKIEPEN